MNDRQIELLVADDTAQTMMAALLAQFLGAKGLIDVEEFMMFLEHAASGLSTDSADETRRAVVKALREKLAALGKMGSGPRLQ